MFSIKKEIKKKHADAAAAVQSSSSLLDALPKCVHVCACVCQVRVCWSTCGAMGQGTREANSVLPDCKVSGVGR